MKLLKQFAVTSTFTLISAFTWAQGMEQNERNSADQEFIRKLTQDNLPMASGEFAPKTRAQKVLRDLSYGVPPGNEGILGSEDELPTEDILQQDYPLNLFLRETLVEAERKPMGKRILFYENKVAQILTRGNRPNEEGVRLVLNRSVDTVQNIIKSAGQNPDLVAQFINQFYVQNFEIALAFANNPPSIEEQVFPRARVGIYHSRMLYSNHGGLISDSAKAIMLIKILGYLGQDLNSDVKRRSTDYSVALRKIINIQKHDESYQAVLDSLAAHQEPRSSDLASLRSEIGQILQSLPRN